MNPADASYALAAQELVPARLRRPRPHRRPAHRRGAASRRRAGDRPPGRPGRRARHRRRLAAAQPPTSWTSSRRSSAAAAGWSCSRSATRTSTATTCRSCSAASASRSSAPPCRRAPAGTRTSRPGCWPTSAPPSARALLAGVAEACFYRAGVLRLDGAPGAQVIAATSATADPAGQPLAAALQAGPGPGRGLRRLRPVRRRLDRGARPPDAVDQRRHLGRGRVAAHRGDGRARGRPRSSSRCRRRRAATSTGSR